ncbi:TetR/AcrR family transcriptional regulator [Amycolatopsis benzoatilytica]|uniref:TetR/AcrR family transcriptional regulator n=1 Tax=Amycolatopsis benzoatilytica TaxID=346045 RepID=UPI0003797F37|nr:TetR/AcrR family transcriptional regulator [Amycolatopsis benzoatilytica]
MTDRRTQVLESALQVFARYGYRKTSMDDVAKAADISRPGLYFHFSSKPELFRATVQHSLEDGVEAARRSLADSGQSLPERLAEAFDQWCGRYVGPMSAEIDVLVDANPDLLGDLPAEYPRRFRDIVAEAIGGDRADAVADTLISTAAGIKHNAVTRDEFRTRMTIAIDLYCGR